MLTDSEGGSFSTIRSLVVTSSTEFEEGTYTYAKTANNTARVTYQLMPEAGYMENGTLTFNYSTSTAGTFTLSASYNDGGTPGTLTGTGTFSFSGNEVVLVPALTSAGTASTLSGQSFNYTAVFSGSPTSYSGSGLPAGLSLNTSTGVISGTTATAGTYQMALGATNGGGTGTGPFTLTVVPPGPPPTVTALTPAMGGTAGDTRVTITGTGFAGATGVTIGGAAATRVSVVNATTITATTPARTAGTASVVVTTPNGSNAANSLFTYLPSPTVTSSTADLFANATTITLTGTGFSTIPRNNTVAFFPTGTGIVAASTATSLTVTNLSGLVPGPLNVVVTVNGISSGPAVQVGSVVVPPPPGSLDATFNTDTSGGVGVYATAALPDGKMIIVGGFTAVGGVARANIARLHADGSVDDTFTASTNNQTYCVAVQADGKVVIGGLFTSVNGSAVSTTTGVNHIARLNADGTRDTSFNTSGGIGLGGTNHIVRSVAVQADGKLVIGGTFSIVNGSSVSLTTGVNNITRLNADGTRDMAFNTSGGIGLGGVTSTVSAPVYASVHSVVVQADGKLVIGGDFTRVNGSAVSTATGVNNIARLNADGTRDMSFNASGGTGLGGTNNVVNSVALQADGKLVIGGWFTSVNGSVVSTTSGVNRVARLNANGTRDMSFNTSGGTGLGGTNDAVYSVAVQADGKLVLGGSFTSVNGSAVSTTTGVNRIARLNANGTRDTAFNASDGNGLGGVHGAVQSVSLQADGALVVGGLFSSVNGVPCIDLVRLTNDAAFLSLTAPDTTQVLWSHSGAGPELSAATFEQSTDGGTNWTPLGAGSRVGTSSNWRLAGLSLPGFVSIRARGRTIGGHMNGSSGIIEQEVLFTPQAPAVILSTSSLASNATTLTITGSGFSTTPGNNTVAFSPTGSGVVTVSTATSLTVTSLSGLTLGALNAVVMTDGDSSGAPIQVATVVTGPPGDVPTVASVSPSSGPTGGNDSVIITGTNFTDATNVIFGGTPAASFHVFNATTIYANTPAHVAGLIDVVVTTPGGSGCGVGRYRYVYANQPPIITSHGGERPTSLFVGEGGTAVTTLAATDPDVPGTQTLAFGMDGADADLFTIDPVTGVLSFITAPDFESPEDAGGNNVYNITVMASDSHSPPASHSLDLSITVTDVNEAAQAIAQHAFLKAGNSEMGDSFGTAVAVFGDTVVVGSREDSSTTGVNTTPNENAPESGAVYVFVRNGTTWAQQAYLKPHNTGEGDGFGRSVAISGDTVVIGAPLEGGSSTGVNGASDDNTPYAGAAYVFVRNGTTWTQQAYLKASSTSVEDWFGMSVDVAGDTVIVGAPFEDSSTTGVNSTSNDSAFNSGAAYVFVRSGTTWSQQAYLKAGNTGDWDRFGYSVAVSDDTVVVGASQENSSSTGVNGTSDENKEASGAAYVFVRNGVTWTQQAFLKASNTGQGDLFGSAVSMAGNTVVIGAPGEDSSVPGVNSMPDENAPESGAVYVFVRSGSVWTQQAYLKTDHVGIVHGFGFDVAISGDKVVAGLYYEPSNTTGVNSTPDEGAPDSGAAYVFMRSGTTWAQQSFLKASNTGTGDQFGQSVAVSGATTVIGAALEGSSSTGVNGLPNDNALNSGAVYVFVDTGLLAAEIVVEQPLGTNIANGEQRSYGAVNVGGTQDLTFTLKNIGNAGLTLSGNPKVAVNGPNAAMFTVTAQPASPVVAGGGAIFTVRFAPTSIGTKTAALSIANDDGNENPFTIGLIGTGTVAVPTVTGVSPASGPIAGGTSVTITGTNLSGATGVTIGGVAATSLSANTATSITCVTPAGTTGAKSVVVTTLGGSNGANSLFTYITAPTVTSVSPASGSAGGGTSVTITGTNLSGATGVTIGGVAATSLSANTATSITCVTPAGTAGARSVVVTTPGGSNGANSLFTYIAAPAVTSSTANLPASTTSLTIIGTGFSTTPGNNTVVFTPAGTGTVTASTATSLTVTSLSGLTPGALSTVVTTNGQSSGAAVQVAMVVAAPTVTSITPISGSTAGGTSVTITGMNLSGATGVTIGGVAATSLSANTATSITCVTPTATAGAKSVVVTTSGGSNAANLLFTYVAAPTVASMSPPSGPTAGGTSVTITGTNLSGATGVTIDGVVATSLSANTATSITFVTPAGAPGAKNVVVTTPGGSNGANSLYTYIAPPTVTSSTASLAANAATLTITGTNFNTTASNNTVVFNNSAVGFVTAATATELTVTFSTKPASAGSLSATVTNTGGSSTTTQVATVTPVITSSTASLASDATTMTLNGFGFSPTAASNTVTFSPAGSGSVATSTPTSLTVTSLSGLSLGTLNAVVTTSGQSSGSAVQVATIIPPSAGSLDATFNAAVNGGEVFASVVLPDGKMVIGGSFTSVGGVPHMTIARLLPDGSVDPTFTASTNGGVLGIAVQADGKLVLGGSFTRVNGSVASATTGVNNIARLNADGSLDTAFNTSGGTGLGGTNFAVRSVAVQADGRLVLGGDFTSVNGSTVSTATGVNRIARLNADGTRDTTFNTSGGTGLGGTGGSVMSVAVQADGKLVLGGDFTSVNGSTPGASGVNRIARLNADGTRDATFNTGSGTNSTVFSVVVQADGKLVLGGAFTRINGSTISPTTGVNYFTRLNADGTRDTAFNTSLGGTNGIVYSVAVQADGKLLMGGRFTSVNGSTVSTTTGVNRIARLNANGTLDTAFNTDLGGVNDTINSVAVQPDGRLLLGGSFTTVNGTERSLFARLINDAASQSLTSANTTQVLWSRSGAGPELTAVTFEQSTDGGANWTALGAGTRVGSTANWQITGLSLPSAVSVRVRGRTTGGYGSGSSSLIEQVAAFTGLSAPAPTVSTNTSNLASNASSLTIFGSNFSTTPGNNTVAFTPAGTGVVTASTATSLTVTSLSGLTPGALNAVVTTNGVSSGAAVQVAYVLPAPTVTSVTPASGPTTGGTSLTITGTNLNGATGVTIGGMAATGLSANTATSITCVTPAGTAGVRSVVVTTANGSSLANSWYTYVAVPTVTSIAPASGAAAGGTSVTITGTNLSNATGVTIGGVAATGLSASTATSITCVTPAGTAGAKSVVVTTPGGSNGANSLYTYIPAPTVTSSTASLAANAATLTITGTNFNTTAANNTIVFNNSAVGTVTAATATQLTVTFSTKPATAGGLTAVVTHSGGSSSAIQVATVTPVITTSSASLAMGATTMTLHGFGFSPAAASNTVTFTPAGSGTVTAATPTTLTVTGLSGLSAGALNAAVATNGQSSGSAAQVATVVAAPTVASIAPASGPLAGGISVTITGTNLSNATGVTIGGATATSLSANTATSITCVTPEGTAGSSSVVVTTPGGSNAANSLYTYIPAPTVTSSTASLLVNTTTLTITGTGFNPTAAGNTVVFDNGAVGTVTAATATQLTVTNLSGLTLGALNAIVTAHGQDSGGAVQVATVIPLPAGFLDTPFNVAISTGGSITATALLPDGRMIIAGNFTTVGGVTHNNIARLNADGSVDASFTASINSGVRCVAVQADGRLVIVGSFTAVNGSAVNTTTGVNRIARLNADGTRDTAFNASGGTGLGGADNTVRCVAVQADGKLVLGGDFTSVNGSAVSTITGVNRIARLNADGTRDTTFNASGGAGLGGTNNVVNSVVVQADGRLVLGGAFTSVNGSTVSTTTGVNRIARLNGDGTRDTSFNTASGTGLGGVNGGVYSVALQADGKLVLGGDFTSVNGSTVSTTTGVNRIARLNADGTRDTTFNASGGTGLGGADSAVYSVTLQTDGKVILGGDFTSVNGSTVSTTTGVNRLARLNADGTRDTVFNTSSGTGLGGADNSVRSVAVQADGRLVVGGFFTSVNGTARSFLARLTNDAATQTLTAPYTTQLVWSRGGAGPELTSVTFEQSMDGGTNWTSLGAGTRVGSTADWQLTGLSLPGSVSIRARGRTTQGYQNGGSSLIEQVAAFTGLMAQPLTVTPSTASLASTATTLTITGTGFSTTPGNNTVAFSPAGTGIVTASTATSLTVTSLSGLTLGSLSAVVTTGGQSSGAAVQVATVIPPPAGSLDAAFNPAVAGGYGTVIATAALPDGKMMIGGSFTTVGGAPHENIARLNADGSVDASYTASANSFVQSMAVQADGKLVIGGGFTSVNGSPESETTGVNRIARLNADGTRDTTFNTSGGTGLGGTNEGVYSVVVQADGKLVLGGNFTSVNGSTVSATTGVNRIARLNADGTRDLAFNTSGGTGLGGADQYVQSVAVQADGKLVLGGAFISVNGSTVSPTTGVNGITRLNADGTLDMTFNRDGGGVGLGGVNYAVYSVVVQPDGKLVIGGAFSSVNGSPIDETTGLNNVARLNADGTLDATFNTSGGIGLGGVNNAISCMALQVDGKLVLGGHFSRVNGSTASPTTGVNRVARLNADGTLDTTFNTSSGAGLGGVNDQVLSLMLQADGRLVVGGTFTSVNGTPRSLLARLTNDSATQSLTVPDTTQVLWSRGGAGPEISAATFEQSTDGGTSWTALGSGARVGATANWQLTGLHLPSSVSVRVRGRMASGTGAGSSGLIEQVAAFNGLPSPFPIVSPSTAGLASSGTTLTITGTGFSTTPGGNTVAFFPSGTGIVTASTTTSLTVTSLSGLTAGPLNAVVTSNGWSSGGAVQVATVVPAPMVAAVSPTMGPMTGGTSVTITGTGFIGATAVSFGGTAATSFTVVNATTITATTPSHTVGTVDVGVTTPYGTDAGVSVYTYSTNNTAPIITSNGGGTAVQIRMSENNNFATKVTAVDPEVPATQTLTYLKSGIDAGLFTIHPNDGTLSFNTAPDFEAPLDADGDNVYQVTVIARDNATPVANASQALRIAVTDVNESALGIAQQAYLKANNTGNNDEFGYSVAVFGNTVVVGAPFEDGASAGVGGVQDDGNFNTGAAYIFVRDGNTWTQQAYLKASNTPYGTNDEFGHAVAISGDTVVVGSHLEDSSATSVGGNQTNNNAVNSGAAYVFVRSGTTWTQQAYLKASNSEGSDNFGWSVAVSGETIIVGATGESSSTTGVGSTPNNGLVAAGAAYIFLRSGATWTQQAYLKAGNSGLQDCFGTSVAVSGDTAVVGAPYEDSASSGVNSTPDENATEAGAAYVFVRSGTTWAQEAYLKAGNNQREQYFGCSVGVSNGTVVVGSRGERSFSTAVDSSPSYSGSLRGAAYVFARSGSTWAQQAYLKPSHFFGSDGFGSAVGVDGEIIVVSAPNESSVSSGVNSAYSSTGGGSYSGAAYVFVRGGSVWTEQAYLKASNPGSNDEFGWAVGVSGGTVVAGAHWESSSTTGINSTPNDASSQSGAAYVFTGFGSAILPELVVEQPVNFDVPDGGSRNFGSTAVGGALETTFTVRNGGGGELSLVGVPKVRITGVDAAQFSLFTQPASPLVAGGSTTFTVRFTPASAGVKSALLSFVSNDVDESPFDVILSGTGSAPMESWRQYYFGMGSNSGNAADGFDYDSDGIPNLLEWACNLNPTTASALPLAATRNGANMEFTYTRSISALNAGAAFAVEWSDTLALGAWNSTAVTEVILLDNGVVQQVKATLPAGSSGRRFVRLKVTAP